MTGESALEQLLRRDRAVVLGALVAVIAASWIYVLAGGGMGMSAVETTAMSGAGQTGAMGGSPSDGLRAMGMAVMAPAAWTPGYAFLVFAMWWTMMMAMMLPSAAPMILLHAGIGRKTHGHAAPFRGTAAFAAGYLLVWGGFSAGAVALQWALARSGLLSPVMASTSAILGAVLLIAAGIYQLTPLKYACLRHCRSPVVFISQYWRPGTWGALRMGVAHGAFCLGCCWVLMGLLFYGGVMNLYWIIGLAVFVLVEKIAPAGHWVARIASFWLILWGVALVAAWI